MYNKIINRINISYFLKQGVLEAIYAFITVVTFIWVLTQLAIYLSNQPERLSLKNNTITLTPFNAQVVGNLTFSPTVLEEKKDNFEYTYGKKLLKERKNRFVNSWTDTEASLTWYLKIKDRTSINLLVEGQYTATDGGEVELKFNEEVYVIKLDSTNASGKFRTLFKTKLYVKKEGLQTIKLKEKSINKVSSFRFKSIKIKAE